MALLSAATAALAPPPINTTVTTTEDDTHSISQTTTTTTTTTTSNSASASVSTIMGGMHDLGADEDLDWLLEKATIALSERRKGELKLNEMEMEQMQVDEGDEGEGVGKKKNMKKKNGGNAGRLSTKIKLNPSLPISSTSYFIEKSKSQKGAIRLDPSKYDIVDAKEPSLSSGPVLDQKVAKGLGGIVAKRKGILEKVVVVGNKGKGDVVAPGLDYDKKTKKKMERETTGSKWFDMPAPDLTDAIKKDLLVLKSRGVLDPKRFYKKTDAKAPTFPKFFQIGTVVEGAADYYNGRLTKRERKNGIVEELLSDEKTKKYLKRKFGEVQERQEGNRRRPTVKKGRKFLGVKGGRVGKKK
ncbi:hypothetical protein HDU76_004481 [Blyttiomyces sp. JEL0837]|nr:hypothetical protein HDU76_004481 [Blyttiomyces sp. JEL0837]